MTKWQSQRNHFMSSITLVGLEWPSGGANNSLDFLHSSFGVLNLQVEELEIQGGQVVELEIQDGARNPFMSSIPLFGVQKGQVVELEILSYPEFLQWLQNGQKWWSQKSTSFPLILLWGLEWPCGGARNPLYSPQFQIGQVVDLKILLLNLHNYRLDRWQIQKNPHFYSPQFQIRQVVDLEII